MSSQKPLQIDSHRSNEKSTFTLNQGSMVLMSKRSNNRNNSLDKSIVNMSVDVQVDNDHHNSSMFENTYESKLY